MRDCMRKCTGKALYTWLADLCWYWTVYTDFPGYRITWIMSYTCLHKRYPGMILSRTHMVICGHKLFVFGRSLTFFSFAVNSKLATTDNSIFPQNHLFLIMSLWWQLTLLVLENKKQQISSLRKEVCFNKLCVWWTSCKFLFSFCGQSV